MYVRQVAWLGSKVKSELEGDKTRFEIIAEETPDSSYLILPVLPGCEYVLRDLQELGYQLSNGMGAAPLSFEEINAWAILTKTEISSWEVFALRRLSSCYVDQARLSEEKNCQPPWVATSESTPERRQKVDSFFKKLAASSRKKSK